MNARNDYYQEIKLAKQTHWNEFLENADSEQVWKAYKYCKQKRIEKTPIIQYSKKNLTTFNKKSKAFLAALLPDNSANNNNTAASANSIANYTNQSESHSNINENQWNWPELTKNELEDTMLASSNKSVAGPDKISFLILKKAYATIPQLFFQLYYMLIKLGFHPDCWKDSIGVVIKKLNKENYSDPKSYRIISLLNYLGKISEKIIAERLSYIAETIDLLYHDQIGNRKKKSAIDAAISLLSDIEIKKHEKKLTSCLFLDITGAYNHINKS